jgi:hypothetical protein
MRLKITLAVTAATLTAGTALLLAAPSASAQNCPAGTAPKTIYVGPQPVGICVPYQHCDPGPCTPPPTERASR